MTFSTLPLSYCTNVHPGRSVDEVLAGLERYTLGIRDRFGAPLAAGLWLAQPVIRELSTEPNAFDRLHNWLRDEHLPCYTLNAFPYGDFHSERVKEQVYVPDWTTPTRETYTLECARVLAKLLPDGVEGSISTVPLGFKALVTARDFQPRCIERLMSLATSLDELRQTTGRTIRLAIEPEPLCVLETTDETIRFFRELRSAAERENKRQFVDTHIGVCYDVCHQAVEFEDVAASIRRLAQEQIRINKVHISCAIHVDRPIELEQRTALARYIEPRYLHQTFARTPAGEIASQTDLNQALLDNPPEPFRKAPAWRVHFHVPVNAESLGPLRTTRPELEQALATVPELDYAPHLEVETYTWEVLPGGGKTELAEGFARELVATQRLLQSLNAPY